MERSVVTGLGCICSLGNNLSEVMEQIFAGVCGIRKIESFDVSGSGVKIAGEVPCDVRELVQEKDKLGSMDRVSVLAIKAAEEAIANAGLDLKQEKADRVGVIVGSCVGGAISYEHALELWDEKKEIAPKEFKKAQFQTISRNMAYYFGVAGQATNIANACAAGNIAVGYAARLIENGDLDVAIVGGTDAFSRLPFSGFSVLQSLDEEPCSPFSGSKGLNLGEGAGILILESARHAKERNAKVYCNVVESMVSSDAYHITAPNPAGTEQEYVMLKVLQDAGMSASDIDYVSAHGTGTRLNDTMESSVLERIFGEENPEVKISSTKSMIGHCLGAAGALEAVFSIKAMEFDQIPPTIHYTEGGERRLDFVPNVAQKAEIHTFLNNSFAFGGNNACTVFSDTWNKRETGREKKDVVITGLGIVSALGIGKDEYRRNYADGVCAGHNKEDLDERIVCRKSAGIRNICFEDYIKSMGMLRKVDRTTKFVLIAGEQCLEDAGGTVDASNERTLGLVVGTSDGPAQEWVNLARSVIRGGIKGGNALSFTNSVYNSAGGHFSIYKKIKGYSVSLVNGFCAGMDAVSHSFDLIRDGICESVLAIGADEECEMTQIMYDHLGMLRNENGDGFVLGEGATSLYLESEATAKERNVEIYAKVLGTAIINEPMLYETMQDCCKTLGRLIRKVLYASGCVEGDIDLVLGFGNGSRVLEAAQKEACEAAFGAGVSIMNIKEQTGEARAAASALQVAHGAMLLKESENGINHVLALGYSNYGGFSAVVLGRYEKR